MRALCTTSPGCSTRPSTRWARSATRAPPRRCCALLDDELLRGPVLEALGRLAGREALPAPGAATSTTPTPRCATLAIRAVVAIEQRATAAGESLDPEVQAALRREDLVDHLLATLDDDDPHNRRTAAITLGWLKEPRAERPLIELLGEPRAAGVRHPRAGLDRLPRPRRLRLRPRPPRRRGAPGHHALPGLDRAAAGASRSWRPLIHDPSTEVRAEAAAAIGRLGDEDAAMLLFELLGDESELIQESAMSALSRLPPERVVPLLLQALAQRRRCRCACARPRRWACCATPRPRPP